MELSTEGNSSAPIKTGDYSTSLSTSSTLTTTSSASLTLASISARTADILQQSTITDLSIRTNHEEHAWLDGLYARQTSESSSSRSLAAAAITHSSLILAAQSTGSSSSTTSGDSSSTASQTGPSASPTAPLIQVGPYSCTTSIGISTLTEVLADYFRNTENDLEATFKYLEFNVHSAAPFDNPSATADVPDPARLPGFGNYISEIVNSSLSSFIYTPSALEAERANLNQSWFARSAELRPYSEYFTTHPLEDGSGLYTTDGWPSTSIIMLQRALRTIVSMGSIDAQMLQYNWTADAETIFPPGYISNTIDTTISANGSVTSGCLYLPNVTDLSAVNSSWAISASLPNLTSLDTTANAALNLSACGISPILNTTLSSNLASQNGSVYLDYIRDTIWGWDVGEPSDVDDDGPTGTQHCAVANITNGGRWQVADCDAQHYGVCRHNNLPYNWTVGEGKAFYYQTERTCDDHTSFTVPRTALENRYMLDALRNWAAAQDDDDGNTELFWLNYNDLDITGCWVTGVNETCPYEDEKRDMKRTVVIPTVAGVIVFLLAILTITVKCAANRRNTRRRRKRGEGGWDYEGVPS